jgi:pimeloyl-ACP methyl ester carboxylesterase
MADFEAVLEQAGIEQPIVLVGCSMGGGMAMNFALAHPSRVRALVMVGSAPSGLQLEAADHPKGAEAEQANEAGDLDRAAELEAQVWFDGMDRTADQVDSAARQRAVAMNRLALGHAARGLGTRLPDTATPAAPRLHEIAFPLLVMVGAHDLGYFVAAAEVMAMEVRTARKVVFEDAAHLLNMEHPDRFEREIRSFLAA